MASLFTPVLPRTFPAWIDSQEFGVAHACAIPRIRDSLVLRLVAGRRRANAVHLIHAPGAP
ncbi:MAG TPA: hypothetical protein VGG34_14605 [Opitutaceae bacterium]